MSTRPYQRSLRCAALAVMFAAGCSSWNPRGEGYNDATADWAESMRTPTAKGEITGYDTRAKQIERNLGFR